MKIAGMLQHVLDLLHCCCVMLHGVDPVQSHFGVGTAGLPEGYEEYRGKLFVASGDKCLRYPAALKLTITIERITAARDFTLNSVHSSLK